MSRDAVFGVAKSLLRRARLKADDAIVKGSDLARSFRLELQGNAGLADSRAKKMVACLRRKNGWENITVKRPESEGERLYIALDMLDEVIRKEPNLKILRKIFEGEASQCGVGVLKREGAIVSE